MRLVVATANPHKRTEIREILKGLPYEVLSLEDFPEAPSVIEDGETFEHNARKKAQEIACHTRLLTLADDSGLVVDALDGAPGVHSKRFGGPTDADRNRKLLRMMEHVPKEDRSARFVCVAALAWPDGRQRLVRGVCEGRIGYEPRGEAGFGYDPIFVVGTDGPSSPEVEPFIGKTFAELGAGVKNQISHRARAFQQVRAILQELPR